MARARLHFESWSRAGREFWRYCRAKFAPSCAHPDCRNRRILWRCFRRKSAGVVIEGLRYCQEDCMECALTDALRRLRSVSPRGFAPHRVPLGLVLLSREQLTAEQLRTGLEAQRSAGRGKIGEWLQTLGFASEQQVTCALARQWACPVWRSDIWRANVLPPERSLRPRASLNPGFSKSEFSKLEFAKPGVSKLGSSKTGAGPPPKIPRALLESFVMVPVDYVETTATLHIAFGENIDYSVLYAIEQLIGCRTEFCLAVPSFVRQQLQALSFQRLQSEVVFERVADSGEFSRIVRSYCIRLAASEIRLAASGPHLWVRLLSPTRPPLDLLLGSPRDPFNPAVLPSSAASIA